MTIDGRKELLVTGDWKLALMEHCELREKVEHGLNEALRDIVGASYIPVLYCAEQLVHGTNHMLICKQTLASAQPEEHLTKIILHEPLPADKDQTWRILCIESIC